MKNLFLYLLLFLMFSCNPLYKEFNSINGKREHDSENSLIKIILAHDTSKNSLFIFSRNRSFENNNVNVEGVLYNFSSKETTFFKSIDKSKVEIVSKINNSLTINRDFKEELFILENYLSGKEAYLLNLHDSFSSSEIGSMFYLYDFKESKKLNINAIVIDQDNKLIQ